MLPATERLLGLLKSGVKSLDECPNIEPVFQSFVLSGEYKSYMIKVLQMIDSEPSARIDVLSSNSFIIFRNDHFLLSIQMAGALPLNALPTDGRRYIATAPENGLQAVISPSGSLHAARYRLPEGVDLSVFDPEVRPKLVDDQELDEKSPCYRYNAGEVFKLDFSSPIYVLRLSETSTLDYQWTFDPSTLAPVFPSVTLPSVGRMETLMDVAVSLTGTVLPRENAIGILESLVDHPLHFIRWKAVQGLGALDPPLAIESLKRLTSDSHPHIRRSANSALEQLSVA
ncbi:HEAT repeat domain-containing protein [Sphingomonas sp. PP-CE-1G-424]|uniref:HEAT repeat domain-containing protein n=1 Tax=Sphingomonas sp. PP-CE-1G-424 TaxID=2135658 RepID=UPI001055721E|nr:HEAT repeat domain-containing protein [Sphingomonas sp. PP-CE-1G-424]TCP65059.1 hypothetical protein C8J43_1141 [Sphingomonas sp. PP-CE-1G-424]